MTTKKKPIKRSRAQRGLKQYFYKKNGKPVLSNSYCAFLDVLGFSDRIEESTKDGKGDVLLQEFHAILTKRIRNIGGDTSKSLLYAKSFTDNIILAHPQFSHDLESEFAFVLWSIAEYQFEMAKNGFFIRGGLSFGPLFLDNHTAYGTALIDAYKLESSVAVNPIVVLSDEVRKHVVGHIQFYATSQQAPQNRDLLVNADGKFFVNYLSECFFEPGVDWYALKKHKDQIESALKRYRSRPSVFAKFAWLASYHNYFCKSVRRYAGYDSKLLIARNLATVRFTEPARVGC